MEVNEIKKSLCKLLSEKRYRHSLGVEDVSYDLALIYGEDTNKASIAGLLHDCAKYLTKEEFLTEAKKYQISISEYERKDPNMLHGKIGSIYAKERYGIMDEDILNSILYHTTGRPNMSLLEKIVYVADYIEPTRGRNEILDKAREIAYKNLDEAIVFITNSTLDYLQDKKVDIVPLTKMTYEYYVNQT
ncbi:MAG: HD domain-containing protein [Clostridiales bacterium]|nr:HD domain-containing protein [Clostridiales bacterium]